MEAWVLDPEARAGVRLIKRRISPLSSAEVCVALDAAALNHRDLWCVQGAYPDLRPGCVLGSDGMGRVVACGGADGEAWMGKSVLINPNRAWGSDSAVQGKGYEILGMPSDGTFATHVCVPVDRLHLSGGYLKESEAAALPLAMLTAYRALFTRGALQAGERLLITGIGGGVAVMAMQLAIAIGADVYVSSSSEEKIEKAKGMGACGGYNYAASDAAQQAEGLHVAFDMVLDSAAGAELNLYLSLLRPAGRLVLYGATAGLPPTLDMRRLFWKQLSILGSTMGSDQAFEEALAYVERHRIRPVVDKVFAFKDLPAAFSYMSAAKQFAKIVLSCADG